MRYGRSPWSFLHTSEDRLWGFFVCGYRCQNSWDCKEFADPLYSGFPIRVKAFCYCGYISFLHPHPGVDILPSISVAVQREILLCLTSSLVYIRNVKFAIMLSTRGSLRFENNPSFLRKMIQLSHRNNGIV